MPTNIFTKFDKDRMKTLTLRVEKLILDNVGQFKGHNSGAPGGDLACYRTWSRYAHQSAN